MSTVVLSLTDPAREQGPKGVTAVLRAADVMDALSQADTGLRLTDVSQRTQLSKPTAYRMLQTLMQCELVEQDPATLTYRLGPKIVEYGLRQLQRLELRTVALPHMRRLREETRETITLSIVVGYERQYIEQLESPLEVRQTIEVGRRVPLHAGGSGKAILAFFPPERVDEYFKTVPLEPLTPHTIADPAQLRAELDRVRERGYSYSTQERQSGAAAVAAPLFNHTGDVIGCLSVSGPYGRFTTENIHKYGPLVRAAAEAISRQMGWRPSAAGALS